MKNLKLDNSVSELNKLESQNLNGGGKGSIFYKFGHTLGVIYSKRYWWL